MILSDYKAAFPNEDAPNLESFYNDMYKWGEVYKGKPYWNKVKRSGLYKKGLRRMNLLNAGKTLCDEMSVLCFAEQVEIACNNEKYKAYLDKLMNEQGFWKHVPEMIARAFAEGGGVLREYIKDGQICVNYISAADFLPLSWDNKRITSAVFRSTSFKNGFYYTVFERQQLLPNGRSRTETFLFKSKDENGIGDRCGLDELFGDAPDFVELDIPLPTFQYFRPDVTNNVDFYTPIGISVYANALDTLQALDVAFDSFAREFILGKKRIIVPSSCVQTVVDIETGNQMKYFDADDEAYVALKCDEDKDLKITDNTVELRVDEHIKAINALLNILCFQTGLSAGTLSFDANEGMKTATEVISQESKTARTVKGHKNQLVELFEEFCRAVIELGVNLGDIPRAEYKLSVGFKDNIIIDENTLIDNNIKLTQAGLQSRVDAVMEIFKCDEETAKEKLKRIAKEQNMGGAELDDLFGGDKA